MTTEEIDRRMEDRLRGTSRIAVHKDNLKKKLPAIWLIEQGGTLYESTGWIAHGSTRGMTGQLAHGPTIWVETDDPVELINPRRISS